MQAAEVIFGPVRISTYSYYHSPCKPLLAETRRSGYSDSNELKNLDIWNLAVDNIRPDSDICCM